MVYYKQNEQKKRNRGEPVKMELERSIPPYVTAVLSALQRGGKRGYLVGGSLRDLLRGEVPHDFDLTTDATPDEMLEILGEFRVIPTGLSHGTVTVLSDGHPIEITTHRTDGTYSDSRHPDSVQFTTELCEDLARRDFTVNAMAFSPETGLVDPFGGQADLKKCILRAVGAPEKRFEEDALRILRCFRFVAKLGFSVETNTARAAKDCAARLSLIAVERIFSELTRTVTAPKAAEGLAALFAAGCTPHVFFDVIPDTEQLPRLAALPPDAPLRITALLHKSDDEQARRLIRRWHAPNAFLSSVLSYLSILKEPVPATPYEARRFVCRYHPHFEKGLLLHGVLAAKDVSEALTLTKQVLKNGTAIEIRRLAVNGKELQDAVGVHPTRTSFLLGRLQDLVWQAPEKNRREILLLEARRILQEECLL